MSFEKTFEIGSIFHDGKFIPVEFTCDGENLNPPIFIGYIDPKAESVAIIVDDPDAPDGTFTHWVAWNIPPLGEIPRGIPSRGNVEQPIHVMQGMNDFGKIGYGGPCPPKGHGIHHYHFKVYILDRKLNLNPGVSRKELEKSMDGHVIQCGELVGLYERK
ncbi:YbhB/YbcL family Raf kinase inhibitor-like protein [Thermococcus sp. GR6]|uniref:YbhB/YbcL family Raf kinase inhibitor-like protein n=1 Tax=Thermococcus sp. GR6 TaxID=1638256 RepID=UPI001431CFB8|nr:YbhB/YbcL family Raf kinase inhibitor-like protein [Thermococcus sp. GR6]NJE42324.1 YbhB/YbcL family Raf kinase inhibitor-like protein [Thermococcus sp. GR6]